MVISIKEVVANLIEEVVFKIKTSKNIVIAMVVNSMVDSNHSKDMEIIILDLKPHKKVIVNQTNPLGIILLKK